TKLRHQIERTCCVLQNLNRFDPGNVVEEPAAACVHQQEHSLKFEKIKRAPSFIGRHPTTCMFEQEIFARPQRIENQGNTLIACQPREREELAASGFEVPNVFVAEKIECGTQRCSPCLAPIRLAACTTATIASPTTDAVGTAP